MGQTSLLLVAAMVGTLFAGAVVVGPAQQAKAASSSDPGKIVFVSTRNGTEDNFRDIYTMNPDGSGVTRVTDEATGTGEENSPMLSPDGRKIVFKEYRGPIRVINTDGTGLVRIESIASVLGGSPVWSPDGSKIAFRSDADSNSDTWDPDIFVANADGSGQPVNVTNTPTWNEQDPSWSPDGKRFAFVCYACPGAAGGSNDVYVANADGSGTPAQITSTAQVSEEQPRWSTDGKKIAYTHSEDGNRDVYMMNADGSLRKPLVADPVGSEWDPSWSPDGRRLIFTGTSGPYGSGTDGFVIDADGTNMTNLTNNASSDYMGSWQTNSAPSVVPLRPAPGSTTADRTPLVSAEVHDVQEELAKADVTKLSIDGKAIRRAAFAYDPGTDLLSYTPSSALPYGRHTVRVVAEDSAGAAMVKAWSFRVAKRR